MNKKKHNWNTWENHLRVHEKVLKQYQANITNQNNRYEIEKLTDQYYVMKIEGLELITNKGTLIQVNIEKDIEVQPGGKKLVSRTVGYSYQAWIKGGNNLIRYCSPHETHNRFHHKHDFTKNPAELIRIDNEDWPHVSEFFEELINHY